MDSNILTTTLKTLSENYNIDIDSLIKLSNYLTLPSLPNQDNSSYNLLSLNVIDNQINNELEKAARIIDIIGYLASENLHSLIPNDINKEATSEDAFTQNSKNNYDESFKNEQAQNKDRVNQKETELDSKQTIDFEGLTANSNHFSQGNKNITPDIFTVIHENNSSNLRNLEPLSPSKLLNKTYYPYILGHSF